MLKRSLVVVGLVGILAFNVATAEDAGVMTQAATSQAVSGVSFADIGDHDSNRWMDNSFSFSAGEQSETRYPRTTELSSDQTIADGDVRRVEVALTSSRIGGTPLDVEYAQRASVGVNESGDINRQGRGHEVRVGQRLGVREWRERSWDQPTWYLFAASDDEAIAFHDGEIATQDRVQIGDMQAGVTMERGPFQASLAYVEREVSTQIGRENYSNQQRFTGVTLTWRH